ncbi:MAG: anthranilate synthase component I, partial [Ilumatobacter sp.]|nr:anthranilate synthase component I [Ilumatobacter sp.]
MDLRMRPSREEFHRLAADHTVVPVWAEVLGDLDTPVGAFLKLCGDGEGFLLESVEHGERWARYSFVGHDPVATLELRDGAITKRGQHLSADIPFDKGMLAALDAIVAAYDAPIMPDLPPLQGGVMGYLGYDIVREVEHLPDVPHDDRGLPDAVMSIIGSMAAFDHWRQRIYLIESVPVLHMTGADVDREYDEACERVRAAAAKLA